MAKPKRTTTSTRTKRTPAAMKRRPAKASRRRSEVKTGALQPKPLSRRVLSAVRNAKTKTLPVLDVHDPMKKMRHELRRLKYDLSKAKYRFNIVKRGSLRLAADLTLDQILDDLVATAAIFFEADAVCCMTSDPTDTYLKPRAGFGFHTDYVRRQFIPVERVMSIIDSGTDYLYVEDLRKKCFGDPELVRRENLVSVLSLILRVNGTAVGAVNLYSRGKVRVFSSEEIENAKIFSQQAVIAIRNAQLYNELRDEAQIAKTLLQVAEDVGTLDSLDEVLNRIVIIVTRALNFKICVVFLWDREKRVFLPVKGVGLPPHRSPLFETLILREEELPFSAEELRTRAVISAPTSGGRFPVEKLANVMEERDQRIVPLVIKGKLLGAMVNAGYQGDGLFDERDEMFLRGIAAQAAIAIDDANLFAELERAFWDIIKSLAAAIEVKDRYTHSHSESVILYGSAIAKEMDMSEKDINLICKACLLHDVGKIGIEDNILRKVTPLTQEERKAIELHPVIGAEILGSASSLAEISSIVRHHHEHYDGNGYPDHLKGEEIPLLSRILQIADSFDAMTSDRPYRKALTREEAIEQLKIYSGKQFDPELVKVFLAVLEKKGVSWGGMKEYQPSF